MRVFATAVCIVALGTVMSIHGQRNESVDGTWTGEDSIGEDSIWTLKSSGNSVSGTIQDGGLKGSVSEAFFEGQRLRFKLAGVCVKALCIYTYDCFVSGDSMNVTRTFEIEGRQQPDRTAKYALRRQK